MMHLGLSSYSYPWAVGVPGYPPPADPLTPRGLIDRAAALGVKVVQLADHHPLEQLKPAELGALRAHARARGVSLESGTSGLGYEHLQQCLAAAKRVGARLIRAVTDTATHRPSLAETRDLLAAIEPRLRAEKITLALENHDRFRAAELRHLVDALDSPVIGLCVDTANSLGGSEGPTEVLEILGPRAACLHLKDYTIRRLPHRFGFLVEGCPAGQGQIDVPHWLRRLREMGREVNVILELWPPPEPNPEATLAKEARWIEESVSYLRRFLPD